MKFVAENENEFKNRTWRAIEFLLKPGFVLGLVGALGTGKTTLVKFIAKKLGCKTTVTSPTFIFSKEYSVSNNKGIESIKHLDLYRLKGMKKSQINEVLEWFEAKNSLVIVEWADLIDSKKLFDAVIAIKFLSARKREVSIK